MNKQLAARLLVLAMTLCMVGCGSDGADNAGNTNNSDKSGADIQSTADNAETVDPLDDNLPDVDYDGYKFRILAADNDVDMVYVDELNGSLVNDAVFNANKSVETRFNIELVHVPLSSWNDSNFISSSIMSGSDEFDVGVCHDCTSGSLSLKGLFYDLYQLEYLDFSKPWWPEFTTSQLTLNGKMYIFSN